jgi:dynactin-6
VYLSLLPADFGPERRDKFTIHSRAVVCQDVELKGDITIGSGMVSRFKRMILVFNTCEGTVVHPKATIFAIAGPIVIGANCIIEESAIIVNRLVEFTCSQVASISSHV